MPKYFLSFFYGALYLGKWPKGGRAKCLAKRFTFKGFILLISITIVLSIAKCPKGGDLGCAKNIGALFLEFLPLLAFQKCRKKEQCSKAWYIFRGRQKEIIRCFLALKKMLRYTRKNYSATAHNRGGGSPNSDNAHIKIVFLRASLTILADQ